MAKYRQNLPQLATNMIFLSEGGLLTRMLFSPEFNMPEDNIFLPFAKDASFQQWLKNHYKQFLDVAWKEYGNNQFGFCLMNNMSARAEREIIYEKFKIPADEWRKLIIDSTKALVSLRTEYEQQSNPRSNCPPIVVSGLVTSQGDGYTMDKALTADEAANFHHELIKIYAEETEADYLTATLIKYAEEAVGIVREASKFKLPVVISFTLEVDGNLPSGQSVRVGIYFNMIL